MAEKISLRRLLAKKEIADLIRQFENIAATDYVIYPCDEKVVRLSPENPIHQRLPVQAYGQTIGWVAGEQKGSFFLSALLSFLARDEYEKKALGRETLERYKEVNLLYDIADKLAASLDTEEVSRLVVAETQRIIRADTIQVMILNEKTGQLDTAAITTASQTVFHIDVELAKEAAFSGQAEIIDNIAADRRACRNGTGTGSLLYAPLKIKDKVIGVIGVGSRTTSNYTSGDRKLLSAVALHAALAIENARLYEQLKEEFIDTVRTLAETIEKRDPYTGGHTKRVMEYSLAAGSLLNLSGKQLKQLELAAILHDIGKIGVRDSILLKPERLTAEEFAEIQKHASFGEEILCHIKPLADILPGVKQHHERFDGTGYPEQRAGDSIHILARIIAVADAFDAMTTDRPYRKGLAWKTALAELACQAGSQFDPQVVAAFIQACGQAEPARRKEGYL